MAQDWVKAIPLTTFNSAALLAGYQVINVNGLPQQCFLVRIVNDSTTGVFISYDGSTDNDYIPSHTTADCVLQVASQTNAQPNAQKALFAKGTQVFVRGAAGVGLITLSGYYV